MDTMSPMAETAATHAKRWRDKQRGGPPREPQGCPSLAAYRRHQRDQKASNVEHWEDACDDPDGCREAYNAHMRKKYAKRKAKKEAQKLLEAGDTEPEGQ